MHQFIELSDSELQHVNGGWHPFPRGVFGRDGKPFFGHDVVKVVVPVAVEVGVSMIPGGQVFAPIAAAAAASAVKK